MIGNVKISMIYSTLLFCWLGIPSYSEEWGTVHPVDPIMIGCSPTLPDQIMDTTKLYQKVASLMELDEQKILNLVPTENPFVSTPCPSCRTPFRTRNLDPKQWKYSLDDKTITCQVCDTHFPNKNYPESQSEYLLNTKGEKVEVPFYTDAEGKRYFISALYNTAQHSWLVDQMEALSLLYEATSSDRYARIILLLFDRYAQVFPHYLVKEFRSKRELIDGVWEPLVEYNLVSTGGPFIRNGVDKGPPPSEPMASNMETKLPYGWIESRWGWGRWGGEVQSEMLAIFDRVQKSPVIKELTKELGRDVRSNIVQNFFGEAVRYLLEFPFYYHYTNNASKHIADIVNTGHVLGVQEWIDFGFRWSNAVMEKYHFTSDGLFVESLAYFRVFMATHYDNFIALLQCETANSKDLDRIRKALEFLKKSNNNIESLRFPNGQLPPINDCRHDNWVDPLFRINGRGESRSYSENVLYGSYGHAVLGDGQDDRQIQTHLHFSPFKDVVHAHQDGLSLMLYAFGAELFTDGGYHKSQYRAFNTSTIGHNTVVVDRKNQDGQDTKGDVLWYSDQIPGLSFVKVEDNGVYEGITQRYRRTLIQNSRDIDHPYVIDVFEITGGSSHDYFLYGPTIFESSAKASIPLNTMTSERPLLLAGEKWNQELARPFYGALTNVSEAKTSDNYKIDWKLTDPYHMPEYYHRARYDVERPNILYMVDTAQFVDSAAIGVRSHFIMKNQSSQIFLGDSPSLIRAGMQGGELLEKLRRPSLVVRRVGQSALKSIFIVVHEPYRNAPIIESITREYSSVNPEESIVLVIRKNGSEDRIIISLEDREVKLDQGPVQMQGLFGFVSQSDEKRFAALYGGTNLKFNDKQLLPVAPSFYEGEVTTFESEWDFDSTNVFTVSNPLPTGEVLKGKWINIQFEGSEIHLMYEISHVEQVNGFYKVFVKDETGLRKEGENIQEIFFPRRIMNGPMRYRIYNHAFMEF